MHPTLPIILSGFGLLLTGVLVHAQTQTQTPPTRPPNIVVIMTDDLGWADLGSYGASDVRTPNLDRLAREGVRLTDFYANGVLCTPTRASFISGRYPQRVGLEIPLPSEGVPGGELGLAANGHSLPQLLKNIGYSTALVGKWHLGYKPQFSPNAHGFDQFFGLKSGYHDYYTHDGSDGRADLWENDRPVTADGYTTDLITARSVAFIAANAARPFFLDVAYNAPHWPYQPPGRPSVARDRARHLMPDEPETSTRADYIAMVEQVDRGVGAVLDELQRQSLAEDTLVIFTNDNGGEWLSNNGPLFNRKMTVWEGGIRVPALVRWPGRIPAGTESRQVGITMDLTASILAAAGASVPAEAGLDGMDLLPVFQGRARDFERTVFWRTSFGRTQKAVRSGDWKLVLDGNHSFLYNLRSDPGERKDLAHRHSDVALRLRSLLNDWDQQVSAEAKRPGSN